MRREVWLGHFSPWTWGRGRIGIIDEDECVRLSPVTTALTVEDVRGEAWEFIKLP